VPHDDAGFSRRINDPRLSRLFFRELQRQRNTAERASSTTAKDNVNDRAQPQSGEVARTPRPRCLNDSDLDRYFEAALAKAGVSSDETRGWVPCVLQTRISDSEKGTSTSPERQLEDMCDWCVRYTMRPVRLVAEEVSASMYRRGRRLLLEKLHQDFTNDRVIDPITGVLVKDLVCLMYDRFTRLPEEGGKWIELALAKGLTFHEAYYDRPPRSLSEVIHDLRDDWNRASKEIERNRERIIHALQSRAVKGLPIYGSRTMRLFGHRVQMPDNKVVGFRAVAKERQVIEEQARAVIAGASVHSVVVWLNENGYRNSEGGLWTQNSVMGLLRSPRLAGLIRLKVDRKRHLDKNYRGELFPKELIYPQGGSPVSGFDPPIEPLIPYPLWKQLQDVLDARATKRGPRMKHLGSGFLECWVCACGMNGGQRNGAPTYVCPKNHLRGRSRKSADGPNKIAQDGKRHPTIRAARADLILSEVLFAATEHDYDLADAMPDIDVDAERARVREALLDLDRRSADIAYLLRKGRISREEFEVDDKEIEAEKQGVLTEQAALSVREPVQRLPKGVTLRDLWPKMPIDERREWMSIVFERIVVRPAENVGAENIADRFEFHFQQGYEPPAEELRALLERLEARIRGENKRKRLDPQHEDRMYELHVEGRTTADIAQVFRDSGVQPPAGGKWDPSYVRQVLVRACAAHGVPYVRNKGNKIKTSTDVLKLLAKLMNQLNNYNAVAREMNKLEVATATGKTWTGSNVRSALYALHHAGGESHVARFSGPPCHLSKTMCERVWSMHREEGMTLRQIGEWLKRNGIKTASGKEDWSNSTLLHIVRRVDDERAATGLRKAA